jgi:hypothetical protein
VLNSTEDAHLKVVSCSEGSLYETLGAVKLAKGPQADKKGERCQEANRLGDTMETQMNTVLIIIALLIVGSAIGGNPAYTSSGKKSAKRVRRA